MPAMTGPDEGKTDVQSSSEAAVISRSDSVARHGAGASMVDEAVAAADPVAWCRANQRTIDADFVRKVKARLDAENRELLRVDQVKRRFFSLTSHELKTPLTTMVAFADVLAANRKGNLTPRQLQHLQVMQRNGRRLNVLVEDLFDLARIETGGFKLTPASSRPASCFRTRSPASPRSSSESSRGS
jgi:signal transduction histidine kinase